MLITAQSNSWHGVIILIIVRFCKLACAASRFTVLPSPSHAPFTWAVAEKCHSAAIPKSSSWWQRLALFSVLVLWTSAIRKVGTLGHKLLLACDDLSGFWLPLSVCCIQISLKLSVRTSQILCRLLWHKELLQYSYRYAHAWCIQLASWLGR